jgi:ferredoxin
LGGIRAAAASFILNTLPATHRDFSHGVSSRELLDFVVRYGTVAYVIAEPCIGVKDTACVDACPVDCIHPRKNEPEFEGEAQLYIDPVECIDCGACVPVCPVSAIYALEDLPEKWKHFAEMNAKHYGR